MSDPTRDRVRAALTRGQRTGGSALDEVMALLDDRNTELEAATERWQDAEGELRLQIRAQAAVIARVKDGWRWTDQHHEEPGSWQCTRTHLRRPAEPMTDDEQRVVYDPVTEGDDRG